MDEALAHISQLESQLEAMTKLNGIHWNLAMDKLVKDGSMTEEDYDTFHGMID